MITLFRVVENPAAAGALSGCLLPLLLVPVAVCARRSEVAVTESMPRRHITITGTPASLLVVPALCFTFAMAAFSSYTTTTTRTHKQTRAWALGLGMRQRKGREGHSPAAET